MGTQTTYDAVIIGSGPNGLAAAALLARAGLTVHVIEGADEVGGGLRTRQQTLPGFRHDVCAAVHPMGVLSPCFRRLDLQAQGLRFIHPPASAAHPLSDGPAVLLERSLYHTAAQLDVDEKAYVRLLRPFMTEDSQSLLIDMMGPLRIPRRPLAMARFGFYGLRPASMLARNLFKGERAKALLAGCAAHSVMSFDKWLTGAVGMLFCYTGHLTDWPVVAGGSGEIARALCSIITAHGGTIETGRFVHRMAELPDARAYFFDTAPSQLAQIAEDVLPASYRRRLLRYRYGPGVFKIDYALSGPVPFSDPRCLLASTVHIGGTFDEIAAAEHAAYHGKVPERPFVMLTQQSQFDDSRAPSGKHTGYAYCHVPAGCDQDMTAAIEAQIERFAPGFRDCVLSRRTSTPSDLQRYNPAYVGGAVTGGVADVFQFFTRPVARLNPYSTPDRRIFLCSAATPPGGGVHGMCGYHAARSAFPRELRAAGLEL